MNKDFLLHHRERFSKNGASNFMVEIIDMLLSGEIESIEELRDISEREKSHWEGKDFVAHTYWWGIMSYASMLKIHSQA